VPFEPREKIRSLLRDWWTDRVDTMLFNQLCGLTSQTDTRYTGLQATVAPSISATAANNRWIFSEAGSSSSTVDTDLDSSGDEFTLAMIDKAVTLAKTVTPRIRPARIKGYPQKLYVAFLHPYQVYQLRQGSLGSTLTWAEIQKAVVTAGDASDNPIFKGGRALGVYNGTLLLENPHVTTGAVTTTATTAVRRGVFCGAQAAVMAYGKGFGPDSCNWVEEMFDYEREFGVRASQVLGIKKTIFNSIDFGTITMSSYSPAPA
jgi:N4-gp56 family major capsid protein